MFCLVSYKSLIGPSHSRRGQRVKVSNHIVFQSPLVGCGLQTEKTPDIVSDISSWSALFYNVAILRASGQQRVRRHSNLKYMSKRFCNAFAKNSNTIILVFEVSF